MLKILPLEKADAGYIVKWNDKKTSDFLLQWAGGGYEYPISEKQIIDRIEAMASSNYKIYKIVFEDNMIGTIEVINIDDENKTAKIGRYLLNPELTGRGYGSKALEELVSIAFNDFGLKKVWLSVFDFNKSAIRCYEKTGFKIASQEVRANGWIAINMEITNPAI
ncbi:GNAT family N-acetyltransferase [Sedimentibacter hydroxybenzoicus DSM 7310]|uniref:GNAT family N-acetyltransferase n=1 Tax=Sedimentibacter hydroxybenzoicus DSM 7310 TaxID=1123245 RepID=A0A974GXI7_SEDHY|nr:GNAT family N-acetyltransferase [Sedimentibacter hydroxybenzoicus]NYB75246.1 GNAT family N-acetyltransferase [Sedimentibacter hydroxybenzoicus DSM 7310]